MTSGSPTNPPGPAALVLGVARAGTRPAGRSGSVASSGTIGSSWSRLPSRVEAVPDRDRHPEVALARHQPVAVEARRPSCRSGGACSPGASAAPSPRASSSALSSSERPPLRMYHWRDVTISRGLSPFSKNFTACGDRAGLADELAGLGEHLDHLVCGAAGGLAGDARRSARGPVSVVSHSGASATKRPSRADARPGRQVELAPPGHVGEVAEGADHRDAGALVGLGERVGEHRHLDPEHRGGHRRAEQRLVPLVVGVRDERDAADDELGAGRVDDAPGRRRRGGRRPGGGRRRVVRGPRARPGRPRSGRSRPTGTAPRSSRPRRGRGCAGTPAGRSAGSRSSMVV